MLWQKRYPSLGTFLDEMIHKLDKNAHKTHWTGLPVDALRRKLEIELEEFKVAIEYESVKEAQKELIDIANYAYILWDRLEREEKAHE